MLYKRIVLKNFSKFTDKHTQNSHQGMFCQNMFLKSLQNSQENNFSGVFFFNNVANWKPKTVRNSHWRRSVKKGILKNFANFAKKLLCWSLFFIKLQFWEPATLLKLKKTPTQVLSCETCQIFKNDYFEEHLSTAA